MLIQRAYKFRFYPTAAQRQQLAIDFGCARFAYNISLDARNFCYNALDRRITGIDCSRAITELKQDPDYLWLKDANSTVITQALRDLDTAFTNFFAGRAQYPSFKKKLHAPSVRYQLDQRHITRTFNAGLGFLKLPKLGALKLKWSRAITGIPKMVTVSRDSVGDYYVSMACEESIQPLPKTKAVAGIDVGIKDIVITSDGFKSGAPKYIAQYQRQLKRAQQTLSRRVKGSKRWHNARRRVAKIQRKIARCRADFSHKLSTFLVRTYDTLALEDLNIAGLLKNHKLAKAITDSSLSELIRQITYKAQWYAKQVIQCGRFEPSSKTCSECGAINNALALSDREWQCQSCLTTHDRDINAAKNILTFAAGRSVTVRGDLQTAAVVD